MQDIAIRIAVAIQNFVRPPPRRGGARPPSSTPASWPSSRVIFLALFTLELASDIGGAVETAVNQILHKE